MTQQILIIRLGALGDVARTLPAVAGLRRAQPEAKIHWLVEPAAAGLLEGLPFIDRVIVFPRAALVDALRAGRLLEALRLSRAVVRALRAPGFDLSLDFHALLKSGVLARIAGAPRRIGYAAPFAREGAHWFANEHVLPAQTRISRYRRNAALVEALGALPSDEPPLRREACARSSEAAPRVLLHPGSSPGTPYKRPPPELCIAVLERLAAEAGAEVEVLAGPSQGEAAYAQGIASAAGAGLCQPQRLSETVERLSGFDLFIGGDSGPLHIASLCGLPVLQLLGPTDPVENEPWSGSPWRRVHGERECSPCRRGCAEAACMAQIAVDEVVVAADELLAARGAAGAPGTVAP